MTKQITHICFDLDDTLYEQITPFKQALLSVKPVQEELLREIYASFRMHSNELFFPASEKGNFLSDHAYKTDTASNGRLWYFDK